MVHHSEDQLTALYEQVREIQESRKEFKAEAVLSRQRHEESLAASKKLRENFRQAHAEYGTLMLKVVQCLDAGGHITTDAGGGFSELLAWASKMADNISSLPTSLRRISVCRNCWWRKLLSHLTLLLHEDLG